MREIVKREKPTDLAFLPLPRDGTVRPFAGERGFAVPFLLESDDETSHRGTPAEAPTAEGTSNHHVRHAPSTSRGARDGATVPIDGRSPDPAHRRATRPSALRTT